MMMTRFLNFPQLAIDPAEMAAEVVVVKSRLDAHRADCAGRVDEDAEAEVQARAFASDDPERMAAAMRLQNMNRTRIAKRRVALRREEQRLAKLMEDQSAGAGELPDDEVPFERHDCTHTVLQGE